MSLSTRRRGALASAVLATALLAASAVAAPAGQSSRFFLRQNGCGAAQEAGRLSLERGTTGSNADSANGCGTIGGLPLDEAVFQLEGEALRSIDFTTSSSDGVPLVLDASRDLTGTLSTRSWTGVVGGVGEVVVEATVTGRRLVNGKVQSVALGSGTFRKAASPTSVVTSVPVSFDLPDALQGVELTALTLTTSTRGANLNAGAQSLNGTSFLDVPTLVGE